MEEQKSIERRTRKCARDSARGVRARERGREKKRDN